MSKAIGAPFMPWQRLGADVALERYPDGRYHYPIVVVSVPRQAGKTTFIRGVGLDKCISRPNHQFFYTAQTGKDARERWRDLVHAVKESPLRSRVTVRAAAGSERLITPNGSEFRCWSPVAHALHGYTPPDVVLDEAFAHDQLRGDELMAAIVPAQATLPHRQLWIVSTAGTAESTFLHKFIDDGRAAIEAGEDRGICLIEYGAPPDADMYDPQTWWDIHPALGHTIGEDAIRAAAETLPRAEFERAYGNRRTRTETTLIPAELFGDLADPSMTRPRWSEVVLTYDVAYGGGSGSIVAVWRHGAELRAAVLAAADGHSWMAPAILRHLEDGRPLAVAADDGGETRHVTDELRRAGVDVETTGARDFATATGAVLRMIRDGVLRWDGSEVLAAAAAGAVTRPLGDASAFSRRHSVGDIAALVALTAGAWVLDHRPATMPAPAIYLPRSA